MDYVDALFQSIFAQESSSGKADTSKPNSQNVRGPMQIQESTFEGLKRNGVIPATFRWDNPQDNTAAGKAHIADLWKKYGQIEDPTQRAKAVAAAYYGGEKAVRSDGSIIEFGNRQRPQDPTTVQYANQVVGRMGLKGNSSMDQQSTVTRSVDTGIGAAGDQASAAAGNLIELMQALGVQSRALVPQIGDAALRAATATGDAARAEAGIQTATEAQSRRILQATGADVLDPSSLVFRAQQEAAQAAQAAGRLEPVMQQLQAVDLLKNPLGWLQAQIQLNSVHKQWSLAKGVEERAQGTLNSIQQRTAAQQSINKAALGSIVQEVANKKAQAALAEAEITRFKVEHQVNQEEVSTLRTRLSLVGDDFTRKMQVASLSERHQQWLEGQAAKQGRAVNLVARNSVLAGYGLQGFDSLEEFKSLGPEAEDRITKAARQGGALAGSPGEYVATVQVLNAYQGIRTSNPTQGAVIAVLQEAAQGKLEAVKRTPLDPANQQLAKMSPAQQTEWAVNEAWKEWRQQASKVSMDKLPDTNPLKMDLQIAASAPELADNGPARYVISRLKAGGKTPTEKELLSNAAAEVAAGTKSQEQAALELHAFFERGLAQQDKKLGWGLIGADMSDPLKKTGERTYRIGMGSTGGVLGFGTTKAADANMLNLGEVKRALLQTVTGIRKADESSVLTTPDGA